MFDFKRWNSATVTWIAGFMLFSLYGAVFAAAPDSNGEDLALSPPAGSDLGFFQSIAYAINRSSQQISGWNARLGEQLAIFLHTADPLVFTLAAAFTLLVTSLLVTQLIELRRATPLLVLVGFVGILGMLPNFELLTWRTVNAGYLQPLVLYLVFFISYLPNNFGRLTQARWAIPVLSVVGFLSGLSFENAPLVLLCTSVLSLLLAGGYRQLISKAALPLVALLIGWALLLLAPSTQFRMKFYPEAFGTADISLIDRTLQRIPQVWDMFWSESWILVSLWAFSCLVLYIVRPNSWRISLISAAAVMATWISLTPAPYTESRSFTFAWLIMIAGVLGMILEVWKYKGFASLGVAALMLISIVNLQTIYQQNLLFGQQLSARNQSILEQSTTEKCQTGIYIELIETPQRNRFLNNRDIWVRDSLDQVSGHFGCNIKMSK